MRLDMFLSALDEITELDNAFARPLHVVDVRMKDAQTMAEIAARYGMTVYLQFVPEEDEPIFPDAVEG